MSAYKIIPIFFTFDNNYVVPAAVAFYSLLNRAKDGVYYEMYVLHSDITEEHQNLLSSVASRFTNADLTFINTKDFLQEEWDNGTFNGGFAGSNFTKDTIMRCFPAHFFPQYEKIIYSDVDVVFTSDISALWNIDLTNKYIAAVRNPFLKFSQDELSHMKPEHYKKFKDTHFGGGIWVMNLKKIRQDNLEKSMIDIAKDKTIVKRFNDQDIMNIACDNKVRYLPLNYIAYPYMLDLLQNPKFESHYTKEELWDSIGNPKIIHYAATKPWNTYTCYQDIWWDIFYYLELDKVSDFVSKAKDFDEQKLNKFKKKYKKYKKRFLYVLFVCFMLLILLVLKI